jgi:hypothetical protein
MGHLCRFRGSSEEETRIDLYDLVFGKRPRHSLDEFIPIDLHPLPFALCSLMAHSFILATLLFMGTSRRKFLQNRPMIRDNRLTTGVGEVFIIKIKQQDKKAAEEIWRM